MTNRALVFASAVIVLAGCAPSAARDTAAEPEVRAEIRFSCLWWSPAQMEGMDPNSPPPKTTEVTLSKWEYSDPIGVPNPDIVDAVITLTNSGGAASHLEMEVAAQWKNGPLAHAAQAAWGGPAVLQTFRDVGVPAAQPYTVRVPVDLKKAMKRLEAQHRWPHALRVIVTVRLPGSARPLTNAQAELPIKPGD